MSTINDGGPAFPVQELNADGSPYALTPGMSLRDYFAAKAMVTLIGLASKAPLTADFVSTAAYEMADAMLRARESKQ